MPGGVTAAAASDVESAGGGAMGNESGTSLERVSALVEARADEIVAFAAELIRRPSVNPDLEANEAAERPAQEWLRERLGRMGGSTRSITGRWRRGGRTWRRCGGGAAARGGGR
jgi:hypothetical protein